MTLSFTHFSCSTFAPSTLSIWMSCNKLNAVYEPFTWWCHQMETFSALLAICAGILRSSVNSPRKGQWRGALMFSLICAWINGWVNNGEAGDLRHLRRHRAHFDVTVMREADLEHLYLFTWNWIESWIGYIQSHNNSTYYEYEVRVTSGKSIVYVISLFDNKLCQNSLLLTFLLM